MSHAAHHAPTAIPAALAVLKTTQVVSAPNQTTTSRAIRLGSVALSRRASPYSSGFSHSPKTNPPTKTAP